EELAHENVLANIGRNFDPDDVLPGERRDDTDRLRGKSHRNIVREGSDPRDLHAGRRLELIKGDDRSRTNRFDRAFDFEIEELLAKDLRIPVQTLFIDLGFDLRRLHQE